MIVDLLENWEQYALPDIWGEAFGFVKSVTPDTEEKRYELRGKDMYAIVMSYETKAPEDAAFEAHRKSGVSPELGP